MLKKRLGEMLLEAGVIDEHKLQAALGHQRKWGGRLGQTLVDLKLATEAEIVEALSQKFGYEVVPERALDRSPLLETAVKFIPREFAAKNNLMPFAVDTSTISVAMSDPANIAVVDEIRFRTGRRVRIAIAGDRVIAEAVRRHYFADQEVQPVEAIPIELEAEGAPAETVMAQFGGGTSDAFERFFSRPDPAPPDPAPPPAAAASAAAGRVPHEARAAAAPQPRPTPIEAPAARRRPAAPGPPAPDAATRARPSTPARTTLPPRPEDQPADPPSTIVDLEELMPAADAAPAPMTREQPARGAQVDGVRDTVMDPGAIDLLVEEGEPILASDLSGDIQVEDPFGEQPLAAPADAVAAAAAGDDLAVLGGLEQLARGDAAPEVGKPARMLAALVRLLIHKQVITEQEFLTEFQRK